MKQNLLAIFFFCFIPFTTLFAQYQVIGAIGDKYSALKAITPNLGVPISNEQSTSDGVGRFQRFKSFDIYWHPSTGAHAIYGPIRDRYYALGAERNLGYPVIDVTWCRDRYGKYADFRRFVNPNHPDDASIYWSPRTNAFEVYGAIWVKYKAIKSSGSRLGYPTSAEYKDGQNRRQQFEHGYIKWNARTGAVVNGPVQIDPGTNLIPADE